MIIALRYDLKYYINIGYKFLYLTQTKGDKR